MTISHTLRQPSTNLISHIARAFNRPQPIPHGVTEAMHGVALPNLGFQPLVQSSTS